MNVVKKIDNKDFEYYTIRLPLFLKKSKRIAYISKELEKNHPCFSERCWWKSKLKYKGKSFIASIAVIDKVKLARYKEDNPGKILKFEEKKENIFVIEKELIATVTVIAMFLVILLSFVYLGNAKSKKEKEIVQQKNITDLRVSVENESADKVLTDILKSISLVNGKILSLSVNENQISLNLSRCYPEDLRIKDSSCTELVFKNNIPYFSIQKKLQKSYAGSVIDVNSEIADEMNCHAKIRNLLLSNKVNIINENIEENSFEFETSVLFDLLNDIQCILTNSENSVSELILNKENKAFLVKMKITDCISELCMLMPLLIKYKSVFEDEPVQKKESVIHKHYINREEIGIITDKNGKYVFYKDSDGKIWRERR